MPTTYTTSLGLALPATGELSGTWGSTVNQYITQYLDSAVAGTQTISGSQTAVTLTVTNGSTLTQAGAAVTGSAQFQIINCTGNPAGLLTITAPASSRQYIVLNSTSTNQQVKIVGAGPTTGVTLAAGEKAHVAWNGSDFVKVANLPVALGSQVIGTLPVANGGTGQTSYTDGQLLIGNTTGNTLNKATLTAGSGVTITNGGGSITISATGSGGTVTGVTASTPLASSGGTTPNITLTGTVPVANGGTGQTSYTDGQLLIGNTSGNTLNKATLTAGSGITITNGGGSITIANSAQGAPTLNVVTGTTQAAVNGNQYVLTNAAATTVTLPGSPSAGDIVWVTVANNRTDNVIARNGQNIMGLAEDMTLNAQYASVQLRFVDATRGWRMV